MHSLSVGLATLSHCARTKSRRCKRLIVVFSIEKLTLNLPFLLSFDVFSLVETEFMFMCTTLPTTSCSSCNYNLQNAFKFLPKICVECNKSVFTCGLSTTLPQLWPNSDIIHDRIIDDRSEVRVYRAGGGVRHGKRHKTAEMCRIDEIILSNCFCTLVSLHCRGRRACVKRAVK